MAELRGALIGCGYFARNHLHAWRHLKGVDIVATCDLDAAKARAYAEEFHIPAAYGEPAALLEAESLDFVDIVTQPGTHRPLVELAAHHGVNIICQKPLAPSLGDGHAMVEACRSAGVQFMVHENFRWQTPHRALKRHAADIGPLFFGRVHFRSAFDVYRDQPYLATDERFIIYDLGVHLLDLARFYLGDVAALTCHSQSVNPKVRAEDVATLLLEMQSGACCLVDMSYASKLEQELFPQALVHLEGTEGSLTLHADHQLTKVSAQGVEHFRMPPPSFPWSAPPAELIQASVVAIQQHWLDCLRQGLEPETSGEDNVKTLELVFGAYQSAERGELYRTGGTHEQ